LAWSWDRQSDELGSLDILDVTTGALDREAPEVATGFLDSVEGVDSSTSPKQEHAYLVRRESDTKSYPSCLAGVDCALDPRKTYIHVGALGAVTGLSVLRLDYAPSWSLHWSVHVCLAWP